MDPTHSLSIVLQPINREYEESASYMSKLSFLEKRIREVKDTGDELIETG